MPAGRPSIMTPELAESLLTARRDNILTDRDVCLKCNVSDRTVRLWVRRGLAPDAVEPYASFAMRWEQCKLARQEKLLQAIEDASSEFTGDDPKMRGDYKAAVWLLERIAPRKWGQSAVAAGRQDGDIDIDELLREATEEDDRLDSVLLAPPPPLLEAMRRNIPAVRALLDELEAEEREQVPKLGG